MIRPLTPETLAYGLSTVSDPQVSPDGTRIVYALHTIDPPTKQSRCQVWLCGIDGGQPCPVTPAEECAGGARWSPDGTRIAVTSARARGSAIVVSTAGSAGTAQEITHHAQPIGDLAWSPDGRRVAYTTLYDPANPDEQTPPAGGAPPVRVTRRIDYKDDARGYLNDTRTHVFVVDVASGACYRVTTALVDHACPQWSPDGRWLTVQAPTQPETGARLLLIGVGSGEAQVISPDNCPIQQWAWSPTGDRVIYAGDPGHTFQPDYFLYDVASGTTRRLTDDLSSLPVAAAWGPPSQPVWLDERQVLVHSIRAGASGLEVIDIETGSIELVQRWQARHMGLSVDRAGRYVVQAQTTLTSTGEISVYDRETATTRTITAYGTPVLAAQPAAQWERFLVRRGEFTIEAWLLKPPDFDPDRRYPVILDVHGGPTADYGYGFMAHQQCLATHGFLVVYANPRGSSSYGRRFARQVIGDWGGEDYRDLMAVVDAVLERPYAAPERTGIFGFSYGGYMTAWTISQTHRFKAAVCGEPFFDLESAYGTSMNGHGGIAAHAGGAPHERREWYAAHSPSTFAHWTRTPTLIIQGEADEICPIGQAEQMFVTLKKAGCDVEFARYPGGSHMFFAFGPPEHRADFLARTLAWFKKHLGEPV